MPAMGALKEHPFQSKDAELKWKLLQSHDFSMHAAAAAVALLLLLLTSPTAYGAWDGVAITQADYQGLQALKHDLDDPRGFLRSWNDTGLGACSGAWAGIKCVKGKVIAVQLPWRGLGGQLTEKIGQLTSLRKLSLHDNSIGGQIPSALGFLRDLRGVYLFNNRFAGSIPASLGNCVMLQTLDLSNNTLTGSIPSSISNSSKLYRLNLSYNNITGVIPVAVTRLPLLVFLFLHHNNLSGSIPDTWGDASFGRGFQLESLSLDHNSIYGPIPASLARLQMLETVSLSNNRLIGSIPEEIGSLSKLRTLDLSENSIGGSFPASLCNLSSLVELNLEGNQLQDQIPEAIDGLRNLSVLSLKRNYFSGEIPATFGNISGLSLLDMSDNNLTGNIPDSIETLTNLTFFNVSDNDLSGPVPLLLSERFNSSSFAGNLQLCGYSALVPCPSPPPAIHPPSPSTSERPSRRRLSTKAVILIAVGVLLLHLFLLFCILLSCLLKKKPSESPKGAAAGSTAARGEKGAAAAGAEGEAGGETGGKLVHFDGPLAFTADDLLCATAEIMGKSTYGTVYKATLEDGSQVAVKRLREKIAKGQKEFETEVNVLGRIRHPNLLALRAYYLGPKGEKLLVFDYMPKGSLAAFLHARGPDTPVDWPTRMRIAIGAARGLRHLHIDLSMVHGNLTSGNILLDENADAKIGDFGLSRLMTGAASSNVIATASALGYRAPELSKLKKANAKTDVYSLGVVMLELLTGKSPADSTNGMDLPQWVASIVKEEWTNEVFDLELVKDATAGTATGDELLNTLKLALHCVDPSPAARPEVQQVLQQLEEIKPEVAASMTTFSPSKDDEVVTGVGGAVAEASKTPE